MLWEAVLYATARSTPALRRLGLVGDAVALRSRGSRQRRAWRPHEARCHAAISEAAELSRHRRKVVVLGSGLLRDVPLARLAGLFEQVLLVDAVQLLPARLRARWAGARSIVADLSGGDTEAVGRMAAEPDVDLVVSANLLSQMPLPYRRRSGDWESPAPLTDIAQRHLADLAAFKAPVCLVTDVAYRDRGRDGRDGSETPLVDESLLPTPHETWDWEVAPRGEIDPAFARIHRVCAWRWQRMPKATDALRPARGPA